MFIVILCTANFGVSCLSFFPFPQVTAHPPFSIDLVFEAGPFSAAFSLSGDKFTKELEKKTESFDQQFENTFALESKVGK